MNKQNPFSIYDFLGYLIPGGLLFYSIIVGVHLSNATNLSIETLYDKYSKVNVGEVFIFIIIAYSLGHILSFTSSLTVETYSNWLYDYPSKYLLEFKKKSNEITFRTCVLIIVLLPIAFIELFFAKILKLREKINKPIDYFLKQAIIHKFKILLRKLDLININERVNLDSNEFDFDFHRIITHYTYETSKQHQTRMSNYVALYGFLRNLSLLFNAFTWVYLSFLLKNLNPKYNLDIYKLLIFTGLLIVSYISFLAFVKFYRRYTLEGFMLIVVDDSLNNNSFPIMPLPPC